MDKSKKNIKEEFVKIRDRINQYEDPLDRISLISTYIQELMDSRSTTQIVLSVPCPVTSSPENIDADIRFSYDDNICLEDIYDEFKNDEVLIWFEPDWLSKCNRKLKGCSSIIRETYIEDQSLYIFTQIIRIGIIDGEIKFTLQKGESSNMDELFDPDNIGKESTWLKMGNIPDPTYWLGIANLLLNCEDIWIYSSMYRRLHKETIPSK